MKHQILISIIVLFIIFTLLSCKHEKTHSQYEHNNFKAGANMEGNIINGNEAKRLADNYKDSNSTATEYYKNFFYNGDISSSRTIAYQLTEQTLNAFWEDFKNMWNLHQNEIRLRIHMGFNNATTSLNNAPPNFVPIIEIIKSDPKVIERDTLYKMEAIDIGRQDIPISLPLARTMVGMWTALPVNKIKDALYPFDPNEPDFSRVKFYSFNCQDTKEIYDYLKARENEGAEKYFNLYAGYSEDSNLACGNDGVLGLRTIIQLNDNPLYSKEVGAGPLYEFAYPCPRMCGSDAKGANPCPVPCNTSE